mmetsp:Transcript_83377/g.193766  ORF Transcript_83377/g.193766 Transcript_83377/m.193766 type:complete len:321 (-) Transcript_83377:9-971(-)
MSSHPTAAVAQAASSAASGQGGGTSLGTARRGRLCSGDEAPRVAPTAAPSDPSPHSRSTDSKVGMDVASSKATARRQRRTGVGGEGLSGVIRVPQVPAARGVHSSTPKFRSGSGAAAAAAGLLRCSRDGGVDGVASSCSICSQRARKEAGTYSSTRGFCCTASVVIASSWRSNSEAYRYAKASCLIAQITTSRSSRNSSEAHRSANPLRKTASMTTSRSARNSAGKHCKARPFCRMACSAKPRSRPSAGAAYVIANASCQIAHSTTSGSLRTSSPKCSSSKPLSMTLASTPLRARAASNCARLQSMAPTAMCWREGAIQG